MLRLILVHRYKAPKFSCVFWSSQMVAIYKVRNLSFYWFDSSFIFAVEELHNFYLIINVYLGCTGVSAQCVKIIHIRSFFWSVLSRSRDEYGDLLRRSLYSARARKSTDQKTLRIWHFQAVFFTLSPSILTFAGWILFIHLFIYLFIYLFI